MSRFLPAVPAKALLLTAVLLAATATGAAAQGRQTGTIRGTLLDAQGLVLPGVTVTVRSDALQGVRTTVTDINGNYRILALPPGGYHVVFELSGFAEVVETATVPLGGDVGVNAAMAPAGVVETVEVVGVVPTPIETTITSSNITADEVHALPTSRQPWRIAELQPGLTDNTPNVGQVTINGAFAYDNIFLVDGVDINDNLFGTANSLFVEDAIQETQVLTSGISAEYGRFSGGVINIITRSGGNDFSGSYRLNMYNPSSWTSLTPFEDEPREGDLGDNLDHEITLGGALVRDRLWFFYSGLITRQEGTDTFNETRIRYDTAGREDRNQFKLTATLRPATRCPAATCGEPSPTPARRSASASCRARSPTVKGRRTCSSAPTAARSRTTCSPRSSTRRSGTGSAAGAARRPTSSTLRSSPAPRRWRTTTPRTSTPRIRRTATTGRSPAT